MYFKFWTYIVLLLIKINKVPTATSSFILCVLVCLHYHFYTRRCLIMCLFCCFALLYHFYHYFSRKDLDGLIESNQQIIMWLLQVSNLFLGKKISKKSTEPKLFLQEFAKNYGRSFQKLSCFFRYKSFQYLSTRKVRDLHHLAI